ncbi:MAG: magnesium/cobalt transporter CorA [Thermodesulfobacteriota bacterium]|nr:magnesium/cobalt transporter CorA [Thermodesulfobacteriota bacterium]
MLDFLQWFRMKKDLSPGSLVYAGRPRDFTPTIRLLSYSRDTVNEGTVALTQCADLAEDQTHLMILSGMHDPDMVKQLGQCFSLHPLLLEDAMNTGVRPKLESTEDGIFILLKDVNFDLEEEIVLREQVSLYLKDNVVLVMQEAEHGPWDGLIQRIRKGKGRIRSAGASYLAVALIDALMDRHYTLLGIMSVKAEEIETELEVRQNEELLRRLYRLRREATLLRNSVIPIKDCLVELRRSEDDIFGEEVLPFLQDVRDHAAQVAEATETLNELLTGILELQISLAGMRMNNVMRLLTLVATVFIPLTFLAGIYGMNFEVMPELHWKYGYPALLGLMAVTAIGMFLYFKRKDWL